MNIAHRLPGRAVFAWLPLVLVWSACRGAAGLPGDDWVMRRGGDLVAAGPSVQVSDSVAGDAMLAGGEVAFAGATGGDYLGAAGRQQVAGSIGGSARLAAGEIRMSASVERNATVAGGRVHLLEPAVVGGNAYLSGGEVNVAGRVQQMLQVAGGGVTLDGVFGGDVLVTAERLRVGPRAVISGSLRHRVRPENVTIDPGAQIAGEVVALPPPARPDRPRILRWLWRLAFLVTGLVAVALFPGAGRAAAEVLRRRTGVSIGLGVLWLIAAPVLLIALLLTVIGIPLALIGSAVYMTSLFVGPAVLGLWLGRLILRERVAPTRGGQVMGFLVGGLILVLATLIPFVGPLVLFVAAVLGAGALLAALAERRPAAAGAG